jgi:ATP-binding cassette subfamily C (CFTR/MRP) protein 1
LLPRLLNIGFTFAQPFLITAVLESVQNSETDGIRVRSYELVALTLFVYSGIAVSTSFTCIIHDSIMFNSSHR